MKTVVAVDVDEMSLDIVRELLAESGYRVITFSESAKAMDYVRTADVPIDLFLIDYRTKDQTGFEILKYLKYSDKKNTQAPIIMTSAVSTKENKEKALNLGASEYVLKPFDEWDLMCKIQNVFK